MSLSARDRQALGSIQDQITGSDPQLASLMTMFTRLASGEEMPALEDIRAGGPRPRAAVGRTAARTPYALSRRARRRLSRLPALYVLWLTVAITLITVTLAINCGGGTGSCTQSWAGMGACSGQLPTDSPRPGLPSADRTSGIPLTTRPVAGLAPAPRGRVSARCDTCTQPDTEREQN
jgi:hypothetical protein